MHTCQPLQPATSHLTGLPTSWAFKSQWNSVSLQFNKETINVWWNPINICYFCQLKQYVFSLKVCQKVFCQSKGGKQIKYISSGLISVDVICSGPFILLAWTIFFILNKGSLNSYRFRVKKCECFFPVIFWPSVHK